MGRVAAHSIAVKLFRRWTAELTEIPLPLGERWNGASLGFSLPVAIPLVKTEEKSFVFADGPADGRSKLILFQRLGTGGEIVCGVGSIIPQKFPHSSVESVGTRAGDDIRRRTQAGAELRVGVVGENSELGDGVHGRLENEAAIHTIEVVRAIDQEIVGFGPLA